MCGGNCHSNKRLIMRSQVFEVDLDNVCKILLISLKTFLKRETLEEFSLLDRKFSQASTGKVKKSLLVYKEGKSI